MTAREIADLFADLELRLIESLKRNLLRHKAQEQAEGGVDDVPEKWAAWQAEKLRQLGRFRRENKAIAAEYTHRIDQETKELLAEQFAEADGSEQAFFGINTRRLDALIEEMNTIEKTVEKASLRYMDDVYRKTVLKAAAALNAGGMTLQQATDMATEDFLRQGINCIRYKDGRRVNIASYAEMALRTNATRAMLLGEAQQRERLGIDTVLVSQYGACSDTCLPWQGLVYIDDVWQPYKGAGANKGGYGYSRNGNSYLLLSVAVRAGLFHPNCRHHLTTWIEGVSKRPRPMDKAAIEKVSRLEQQQRELERRVRRFKRLATGSADAETVRRYMEQMRRTQGELRRFVNSHGDVLRRDPWRERYDLPHQPHPQLPGTHWDRKQYANYSLRLGGRMQNISLEKFLDMKKAGDKEFLKLQETYRFVGIVNRTLEKFPGITAYDVPADVEEIYKLPARQLEPRLQNALYHYSHYEEGVRMNCWLGRDNPFIGMGDKIKLTSEEMQLLNETTEALNQMQLPNRTLLWRGSKKELVRGLEKLEEKPIGKWKGESVSMQGFASTSILRSTAYLDSDVVLAIVAPEDISGAGYIEEISYNAAHEGQTENGKILKREYEVLLQKGSEFDILETQKMRLPDDENGNPRYKLFLTVEWRGENGNDKGRE